MKKETFKLSELGININEAHLGPALRVDENQPLPDVLIPHVHDGFVPARLVRRFKALADAKADVKPSENP